MSTSFDPGMAAEFQDAMRQHAEREKVRANGRNDAAVDAGPDVDPETQAAPDSAFCACTAGRRRRFPWSVR